MIRLRYLISALVLTTGALLFWAYRPWSHADAVVPTVTSEQPVVSIDTSSSSIGWQSLDHTACSAIPLTVQGSVPSWLQGTLMRVGPGKFEMGNTHCDYSFDGFSTLYSFTIKNNQITFAHEFLQTGYYKKAVETGAFSCVPQQPKTSLLGKLSALTGKRDPYDNNSISIIQLGNRATALTLTPHMTEFDPNTLQTKGPIQLKDGIECHITTPYPWYDAQTGLWYNILIEYGTTSSYGLYSMNEQGKRTIISSIKTKSPAYIHSIGMSKRYCIVPLIPFTVNPTDLLFSGKPFVDNFTWQDNQPTSFMVIDKQKGTQLKTFQVDPCFVFSQINAFETGNTIVLDMLECPKTEIIDVMKLCNLRNPSYTTPQFSLVRYTLNLANGSVQRKVIAAPSVQLPTVNPHVAQTDYTYLYATAVDRTKLYKINVKTGNITTWSLPGWYCGAPLFVPRPDAHHEDDGVLLSVMVDATTKKSCLMIIDVQTMKEKARAYLPHVVPFDMGGLYISN